MSKPKVISKYIKNIPFARLRKKQGNVLSEIDSAATDALFAAHAQEYQSISAQGAAFHNEFVQQLRDGSGSFLLSGEA